MYLHSKYAGNLGDVCKHIIQVACLNNVEKPATYIDTHAGAGLYNVSQSQNYQQGFAKFQQRVDSILTHTPKSIQTYISIVDQLNHSSTAQTTPLIKSDQLFYPGSPWIAQACLGAHTHYHFCDINEPVLHHLQTNLRKPNTSSYWLENGFKKAISLTKNSVSTNVILIDPPYTKSHEWLEVITTITQLKQNKNNQIIVWYPVFANNNVHKQITEEFKDNAIICEMIFEPKKQQGMKGCGVLFMNGNQKQIQEIAECREYLEQIFK